MFFSQLWLVFYSSPHFLWGFGAFWAHLGPWSQFDSKTLSLFMLWQIAIIKALNWFFWIPLYLTRWFIFENTLSYGDLIFVCHLSRSRFLFFILFLLIVASWQPWYLIVCDAVLPVLLLLYWSCQTAYLHWHAIILGNKFRRINESKNFRHIPLGLKLLFETFKYLWKTFGFLFSYEFYKTLNGRDYYLSALIRKTILQHCSRLKIAHVPYQSDLP